MSSKFESKLNDSKRFNSTYISIKQNSSVKQNDTQEIEDKENENKDYKLEYSKKIENSKDIYKRHIIGKGQIYKSKDIFIEAPHKDVVIGIDDIEREIYIEDVEIANGIASLVVIISENITYSTCKKDSIENIYEVDQNNLDDNIKQDLCIDGVVRSNTSIIPYKMIIDVPGAKTGDKYNIEDAYIDGVTSKYILRNGDIVNNSSTFDDYIIGIQEGYIISVKIKIL